MYVEQVTGACFLNTIDNFWNIPIPNKYQIEEMSGGGGWTISGYINDPSSKKNYKYMTKHYPVLYQSPVRVNTRSNQRCFFVVYDTKKVP